MVKIDPVFEQDLSPAEFTEALTAYFHGPVTDGWTFLGETSRGFEPVGFVTGTTVRKIFYIDAIIWLPTASPKNMLRGMVNWLNEMRKSLLVMQYIEKNNKVETKFWEHIARYGIIKRVGHVDGIYYGSAILFQTRH